MSDGEGIGLAVAARRALVRGLAVGAALGLTLLLFALGLTVKLGPPPKPVEMYLGAVLFGLVLGTIATAPLALIEHLAARLPASASRDALAVAVAWPVALGAVAVGALQLLYAGVLVRDPLAFAAANRAVVDVFRKIRVEEVPFALGFLALLAGPLAAAVGARLRTERLGVQTGLVVLFATLNDALAFIPIVRELRRDPTSAILVLVGLALVVAALVAPALRLADVLERRLEARLRGGAS